MASIQLLILVKYACKRVNDQVSIQFSRKRILRLVLEATNLQLMHSYILLKALNSFIMQINRLILFDKFVSSSHEMKPLRQALSHYITLY